MEDKSVSKRKHLNLEFVDRMMTVCFYLNTYDPFSRNFNNITVWLNLTNVNLSNNMITILPSAFGKLRLKCLDLSQNCLGTFDSTRWPWIKQNIIENTLTLLDISNNSLITLPLYIGRLKALIFLDVSHNILTSLPQSIRNLRNLNILDLSYNKLWYLPVTMIHLNLTYLHISMNPLQTQERHILYQIRVQSLVKLSANIVLRYRILYDTILPTALVQFLEEAEYCCVCDCVGVNLLSIYALHDVSTLAEYVVSARKLIITYKIILFKGHCCPFLCENNSKLGLPRNIRIFARIVHKKVLRFIKGVND